MTATTRQPLGQLLLGRGLIHTPQLDCALEEQRRCNHEKLLGEILIDQDICSEDQIAEALAESDGIPFARVSPRLVDPRIVSVLPHDYLLSNGLLPMFLVEGVLTVAMSEPSNVFLVEEIERRTNHTVQIVAATLADIRSTLEAYLQDEKVFVVDQVDIAPKAGALKLVDESPDAAFEDSATEPAIVKLVEYCVYNAVKETASEIHIEPGSETMRIRYRIDGRLMEKIHPPRRLHPPLVARLKQLAGLDTAVTRLPQEGRLRLADGTHTLTFQLSTAPGRFGEKMVLRVADDDRAVLKLEKLGFSYEMLKQWRKLIAMPSGLLLIAGPSGCGKRSTLYSTLQERNTPDANLCTVEEQIEQTLPGINQFQIDSASGFAFPAMLRAVMKQEPDVLMISDLPDANTARAAAQAALGGRLVLAGMFAVDAPAALARLIHLGVEPHLLGATVTAVLARRLVRKLCSHCREPYTPTSAQRRQLDGDITATTTLHRAKGCDRCHQLGYAGRIGVHELLVPTDAMSDRLSQGIPLKELRALSHDCATRSLRADAIEKAKAGLTTLDEVLRVTT